MTPRVLPPHAKYVSSTVRTVSSYINRGGYIYNSGMNKEKAEAALAMIRFVLQAVGHYGQHMPGLE